MKTIFRAFLIATAVFLSVSAAGAETMKWEFDRAHSSVYFEVKHIYSVVRGSFQDISGTFIFDPNVPEKSEFDIEVQVKSVNTNISKRDNHLRSADFFDAGKYPLMRFKSVEIKHKEGNLYEMKGLLTVKDVTKDVTFPAKFFGVKDNPVDPKTSVAGFETEFEIDRLEYGVGNGKFYQMGVVGKEVKVKVTLEMIRNK